jgi:RNA polymerase sigma-70 factor (ECF subfamily)
MQFVIPTPDHSFVADLYQRYAAPLLLYIGRQVPTREDAEDVLLEVFQAAVESELLTTLNEGRQRSWLWTVAHNKAADYYRRTRRRPAIAATLDEAENALFDDEHEAPEAHALRQEAYAELRMYISSLPELQQEVLRLRFAHGLHCHEIAQRVNKSHGAVRIMLSRTLNLLRDIYKQRGEGQ